MFGSVFAFAVLYRMSELASDIGYFDHTVGLGVFLNFVPLTYCGIALFLNLVLPIFSWGRSTPGLSLFGLTVLKVDHHKVGPIRILAREFLRRIYLALPSAILLTGYTFQYRSLYLESIQDDPSPIRHWIEGPSGDWATAITDDLVIIGWCSMFLGWLIAFFVILINYISMDVDSKRQCWYDKLLGTVVMKRNV